jgi:hypothetical protein
MARVLTQTDRDWIVSEYQAWQGSTADLLEHLGIARQTLYDTLRRRGITTRSRQPDVQPSQQLADGMAREALTVLLEELVKARVEIARLNALLASLQTQSEAPGTGGPGASG